METGAKTFILRPKRKLDDDIEENGATFEELIFNKAGQLSSVKEIEMVQAPEKTLCDIKGDMVK